MVFNLNFLSNNVKSELKCLNTSGGKSQIMEYYSYRKLIPHCTQLE